MGVSDGGKPICVIMAVPTNATYTTKEFMMEEVKEKVEKDEIQEDGEAIKFQSTTKKKSTQEWIPLLAHLIYLYRF